MAKLESIKTGVIGVGSMGQNHARVYNEISNLVGVADPNEKQGRLVAERFGVKWYHDYSELLSKVDAVTIAVPTFLHRKIADDVSSQGVHLLVEKPLADNVKDAQAIVKNAEQASVKLSTGHIERFNPVVSYVKKALEKGMWGDVISMSAKRVSRYPDRIKDVGVIYDLAIHDLDILRYFAGSEVMALQSFGGSIESSDGREDHASIIMRFENGIIGSSEVSWLTPLKVREIVITCNKAYVVVDLMCQEVKILSSTIEANTSNLFDMSQNVKSKIVEIEREEPLKRELSNFLGAVIGEEDILVTGNEGLEVVKLAQKAVKQIHKGEKS